MGIIMRENFIMEICMEKENLFLLMALFMKVNLNIIKLHHHWRGDVKRGTHAVAQHRCKGGAKN